MATSCSQIFYRKSLRLGQSVLSVLLLLWKPLRKSTVETQHTLFPYHSLTCNPHLSSIAGKKYHDMHWDLPLGLKLIQFTLMPTPGSIHTPFTHVCPQSGTVSRRDWEILVSFSVILPFFHRAKDKACLSLIANSLRTLSKGMVYVRIRRKCRDYKYSPDKYYSI